MLDKTKLSQKELEILEDIKNVLDPEVELNIVDLGLIYDVKEDQSKKNIHVLMTLSARGCPVGDTIIQHVETILSNLYTGYTIDVELTWEPQWTPEMITEEGRLML